MNEETQELFQRFSGLVLPEMNLPKGKYDYDKDRTRILNL